MGRKRKPVALAIAARGDATANASMLHQMQQQGITLLARLVVVWNEQQRRHSMPEKVVKDAA
jgi:hypothetical protein